MDATAADLVVLSSKGGQECPGSDTVAVSLDDLQDFSPDPALFPRSEHSALGMGVLTAITFEEDPHARQETSVRITS